MTAPFPVSFLRMLASVHCGGTTFDRQAGDYASSRLVDIADADERDGHELRALAFRVRDLARTLPAAYRYPLNLIASSLLAMADRRAPAHSVHDPDEASNVVPLCAASRLRVVEPIAADGAWP